VKNLRADAAVPSLLPAICGAFADYVSLTKPRLNLLVVATSAAGYYLGASGPVGPAMLWAVAGTGLVAAGAAALNQVAERRTDGLMQRTRSRAVPDGRIGVNDASWFGAVLAAVGLALLAAHASLVAAALAAITLMLYLAVYTPLKRRTPVATLVGAVPGALPPLIGWTAAHGSVSPGGVALFALVFVWQVPHFMAIAWMYRDDYARAGFPMLPVLDPGGRRAGRQAVAYAALLVPVSALPTVAGVSGFAYLVVALPLGLALLWLALRFAAAHEDDAARRLFLGSIAYLPLIWIAMIADRL
jgi:protoheme IX farnesyltransferase